MLNTIPIGSVSGQVLRRRLLWTSPVVANTGVNTQLTGYTSLAGYRSHTLIMRWNGLGADDIDIKFNMIYDSTSQLKTVYPNFIGTLGGNYEFFNFGVGAPILNGQIFDRIEVWVFVNSANPVSFTAVDIMSIA